MPIRVISYGGGVQSTALIVLATQGKIDADVALFANVGDHAENPATLDYMGVIAPWAAERGVSVIEQRWVDRTGKTRDLYDDLVGDNRTIPIPVYMAGGAPGNRQCTSRYKIEVIGRWLRDHGATADDPATVHVGISTDEYQRINARRAQPWETPSYPLINLGLSRQDCANVIARAGLPVPPKSSCWFCPFRSPRRWAEDRRDRPDQFAAGVALEKRLNEKRTAFGKDPVFLTPTLRPLADLPAAQASLFDDSTFNDGGCDEGYCWT